MEANHQGSSIARNPSRVYLITNVINVYQKFISPRKGFVCAHRSLNGGMSCSEYAKSVVARYKLNIAMALFWRRLRTCQKASHIIHEENKADEVDKKDKREDSDDSFNEATNAACCLVDAASCIGDMF